MYDYEVVVGGYGAAYSGSNRRKARKAYREAVYRCLSKALSVTVVVFKDGVTVKEFDGEALITAISSLGTVTRAL